MSVVSLLRTDLHSSIANAAFVVADVAEGKEEAHALHQTFDICEEENEDRTNRLIDLAFSEASAVLLPLIRKGSRPCCGNRLTIRVDLPHDAKGVLAVRLRELLHEFIVARVMEAWLGVTLPVSAPIWKERAGMLLSALETFCADAIRRTRGSSIRRKLTPF